MNPSRPSRKARACLVTAALLLLVAHGPSLARPDQATHPETPNTYERGYQGTAERSVAEKVADLKRSIERDRAKLAELKAELNDPSSEYSRAEDEFRRLETILDDLKTRQRELTDAGNADAAQGIEEEIAEAQTNWNLAKERFELAIDERKTLQEQIRAIEKAVADGKALIDRWLGQTPPEPTPAPAPETPATPPSTEPAPLESPQTDPADPNAPPPEPSEPAAAPEAAISNPLSAALPVPVPAPTQPAAAQSEAAPGTPSSTPAQDASPQDDSSKKATSKEVIQAAETARTKAEAVQEADSKVKRIEAWLAGLEHRISLEQKLLETARKRFDNANDTRATLQEQFRKRTLAGASQDDLVELLARIDEAEVRYREARAASRNQSDRLAELQEDRSRTLSALLRARQDAEQLRREFEQAQGHLNQLQNPFNPRNMLQWLLDHAPRILAIILGVLVIRWMVRITSRRIVPLIASRGARGSREEREDRAHTLVGVFENFLSVAVFIGGTLMLLEECGIPVVPLLGGAAVFGLAVAFGAQNLVRDYFYGFMILLENQYKINDVVRLGDVAGQVEKITLRMTVLRDLEGNVHFVPNGQINRVTNMTHGWSRALFEIRVGYDEDLDRVMAVLMDLGKELRADPAFRLLILEDPTMLGVDALDPSAIIIKFFIKTRTLKQWDVKRELLRRIKRRFDELGIEIPFPHQVVHHRPAEPDAPALRALAEGPHLFSRNPGS